MKNKIKFAAAVLTAVFVLSGLTAYAQSTETAAPTPTPISSNETILEDNRTLTPKGNAQLVDDVTDNENLQFITVTARDGNVFYFVIDKGAQSENVYFLNTVDESDLAALVKGTEAQTITSNTIKPSAAPSQEPAEPEKKTEEKSNNASKDNNNMIYIILALAAIVGIGGYYYKIILPKKKLEQADDIEDFEFEDENSEETINEDENKNSENK